MKYYLFILSLTCVIPLFGGENEFFQNFIAGDTFFENKKFDQAIHCYNIAIKNLEQNYNPVFADVYVNKADALKEMGKYREALALLASITEDKRVKNDVLYRAYSLKGSIYSLLGLREKALNEFKLANEANPAQFDLEITKTYVILKTPLYTSSTKEVQDLQVNLIRKISGCPKEELIFHHGYIIAKKYSNV